MVLETNYEPQYLLPHAAEATQNLELELQNFRPQNDGRLKGE